MRQVAASGHAMPCPRTPPAIPRWKGRGAAPLYCGKRRIILLPAGTQAQYVQDGTKQSAYAVPGRHGSGNASCIKMVEKRAGHAGRCHPCDTTRQRDERKPRHACRMPAGVACNWRRRCNQCYTPGHRACVSVSTRYWMAILCRHDLYATISVMTLGFWCINGRTAFAGMARGDMLTCTAVHACSE
jgi:hypothetical protein